MFIEEFKQAFSTLDNIEADVASAKGLIEKAIHGHNKMQRDLGTAVATDLATLHGSRCTLVRQSGNVSEVLSEDEVARIVLKHLGE